MKKTLIITSIGCIILIGAPFIVFAQSNLPYGSVCTIDANCVSNFCEPLNGVLTCLCQQNSHCPASTPVCNTATNQCYGGVSSCTSNWQCESWYCNTTLGFCASCITDSNCDAGRICTNGSCVESGNQVLSEYGDYCSANNQCQSGICRDLSCRCATNNDCFYETTCVNGDCIRGTVTGNHYCWVVVGGNAEFSWDYDSEAECRSECQSYDCRELYGDDCTNWCCNASDYDSQNVVCSGGASSGGSATIPNPLKCEDIPCVVDGITDLIAGLVTVLGTIMIIIGGIQYISSAGSEDKARRAKNTVLYAVIGIAIAISVDFIVGFLREILSRNN